MNLLAIDTCTQVCSVSLIADGIKVNRLLGDVEKSAGKVLNLCDEVFAEAKINSSDLDGVIYTRGPGAFTGVRMCLSVVQGISLAFDIPTKGYSTLELLGFAAARKYPNKPIAVALDARMNELYWGIYKDHKLVDECLIVADKAPQLSKDFIGVGSGWEVFADALCAQTGVNNFMPDFYPDAQYLIDLYLDKTPDFDQQLPLPTYLRNNVAQKSAALD